MHTIQRTLSSASLLCALCAGAAVEAGAPVQNWRRPLYEIAARRGEFRASPSGMFWDDLGAAAILDTALWPDTAAYAVNHWTLEPALRIGMRDSAYVTGERGYVHVDALSDFRYRNLVVRTSLDVDQRYGDDPDYVWHKNRGAAGRIEEAWIMYEGARGFARLGRINRLWGPFLDRSILLSDNPFSYDAFEWQVHAPFLEFRHLFSAFPERAAARDGAEGGRTRFLTAHSLNFMFGQWAALGVSETVLFARARQPDWQYVNPVSIYSVINTNMEGAGNLMLGFAGWAHPFTKQVTLRGQVVFDDFQVDNEDAGDQEPMHWAYDLGATVVDPAPFPLRHHLTLDYRYLSKWMYTVSPGNTRKGERYSYLGRSLGEQDIDGDMLELRATVLGDNYWTVSLGGYRARQDTNTLGTDWRSPSGHSGSLGYRDETPLSQRDSLRVETGFFVEGIGYFRDYATLTLRLDNRWIRSRPNAALVFEPRIEASITAHFSNFFLTF
jgi:hypothetical protein